MTMQETKTDFVINYKTTGVRGFSSMGYAAPADLCYEEWETAGEVIKRIDRFKNFAIGDWLNAGEWRFGEMYAQAIDEFELGNYDKLSKCKWVARSVPHANRRQDLTWSHHHSVAKLPQDQQITWLEHAVYSQLTAQELTSAIRDSEQRAAIANRNELPPAPQAQPNTQPTRADYRTTDDIDDRAESPAAYDEDDVPFSHHRTDCATRTDLWPDERIDAMVDACACDVEYTDADGYTRTRQYVAAEDVAKLLRTMRDEFETT